MRAHYRIAAWMLLLLGLGVRAGAQQEVGTVAATVGNFQIERGGTMQDARLGAPVFLGDRLHTGASDRAKVVFRDDSVLDLAANTDVTIDTQVFDAGARKYQSLLRLAQGKVRAWVSEYYHSPRARYEVETPTAIAGVRGTEFVAAYDAGAGLTEIVGIADQITVVGTLAVLGAGVEVGPKMYTQVRKGRFPIAPQTLDDARYQRFLQGFDIVGTGRRDGLNVLHPAVVGRLLLPADIPSEGPGAGAPQAAEGVPVPPPRDFLAGRMSRDIHTNTQPLLDYRLRPPGSGSGGVKVEF